MLDARAALRSAADSALPATLGPPEARLRRSAGRGFRPADGIAAEARTLFDLYLPLVNARRLVVAHLGQSLDGCIATHCGDSNFVNGPDNIVHLHRMRALADAIVVGAGTVASDDPQLTTRRVPGASPTRVVIDPGRRLHERYGLFVDGAAPSLVITATAGAERHGRAEVVTLTAGAARLDPAAILAALAARGHDIVFVEGGGTTVSGFLEAGALDRLQVAIAPLVIGAGRRGLTLPARDRLADCLRLEPRVFRMGNDVLFDCDLTAETGSAAAGPLERLR